MHTEQETEEDFERFAREHRNTQRERPQTMTRLGNAVPGEWDIPYPCTPEREAEIERLHRVEKKRQTEEHRSQLISFASECIDGKKGRAAQEIADTVLHSVEYSEMINQGGMAVPENCINLVLWDIRRRVAWASARARGEMVQEKLRTRKECLALYDARGLADERWADNEVANGSNPRGAGAQAAAMAKIPPPIDFGYGNMPPRYEQGAFDDLVRP